MSDMVMVRPRTGLILAGIPASGAAIPRELAEQWIGNQLVVAVEQPEPVKAGPTVRQSPRNPGPPRASKRRRT